MNNSTVTNINQHKMNLLCFLFGRTSSDLGTSVLKFALNLYILDLTGSAAIFSAMLSIGMLPSILINVFGGVYVDKLNKKYILIAMDFVSALAVFIFGYLFRSDGSNLSYIIFCLISLGILQALDGLTIYSSIPNFFEHEKVLSVNSNFQSIGAIVNILGPVLGGVLYHSVGLAAIISIAVITYILSGISEMFLKYKKNKIKVEESYMESFKFVYRYVKSEKTIFKLLMIVLIINFVAIPITSVIIPYFLNNILKVASFEIGIIQGAWSVGVIVGALVSSIQVLQSKLVRKIFLLLQIQGVAVLTLAIPNWMFANQVNLLVIIITYFVILLICGLLNTLVNIPMLTYLQLYVPENIRSSIYGIVNTCITIVAPISIWLYGIVIEKQGITLSVVFSGVIIILVGSIANLSGSLKDFFTKSREIDPVIENGNP